MRFIIYFILLTIFPFNDFLTQVNTLTKENDNTSSSDFHKAEFKGLPITEFVLPCPTIF